MPRSDTVISFQQLLEIRTFLRRLPKRDEVHDTKCICPQVASLAFCVLLGAPLRACVSAENTLHDLQTRSGLLRPTQRPRSQAPARREALLIQVSANEAQILTSWQFAILPLRCKPSAAMLAGHKNPLLPPMLCPCRWKLPKCLLRTMLHTRLGAFLNIILKHTRAGTTIISTNPHKLCPAAPGHASLREFTWALDGSLLNLLTFWVPTWSLMMPSMLSHERLVYLWINSNTCSRVSIKDCPCSMTGLD